jgi:threonine dehydrogenase-like Zn-dependent dehydrogenase
VAAWMQVVHFLGNSRVEVRQAPQAEPGPGEALVRIETSAICGSELPAYRGAGCTEPRHNSGHEMAGTIAKANGLCRFHEGERVGLQIMKGCGRCMACLQGDPKHCITGEHYLMDGHGDFVVAPEICLVPLPDDLSWEAAVLLCGDTLGTPYRALKRLGGVQSGQVAAVFGCGPIGLGMLTWLKYYGARTLVSEPNSYRRALAARLGADLVLDPGEGNVVERIREQTGGGADLCLDCSEAAQTLNDALDAARVWGRVAMIGEKAAVTIRPSDQAIVKELTIAASWYFTAADFFEELDHFRRGLPLGDLITHRYALAEAPEAYAQFAAGQTGKAVFVRNTAGR